MQIVWSQPTPISKTQVSELAEPLRGWTPQTVYTLLNRLTEKKFLSTEKHGKERYYSPLIAQAEYLNQETGRFMKMFHQNSLTGLMNALYAGDSPNEQDLLELEQWLREKKSE
jgi:predicted transcriptional regulator